ncbi:hypothetical protein LZC95_23465 [Pendulispora brunnea]|uniref:Tetratricopeptide repeat protein n=1 Tax=Pendulispora brunnea TaxID=2905690 RepID=A0ABZ2KM82_9BACT
MDAADLETLVARLVQNPHDEEALAAAHDSGNNDPKAYALLLEKVGSLTLDPAYASHWLSEAANVWLQTLGDAHRAARVLMEAVDRDPTQSLAAERLAQLYRDKENVRGLAALLDRRAKALAPLVPYHPELVPELAQMHEELGRLWSEAPLSQPKKAIESFRKAIELEPTNAYAIYCGRELCKTHGQWDDAYLLYDMELSLVDDPERKVALLRDEAQTRQRAGDLAGATGALMRARVFDEEDPELSQELASSVVDRVQAGEQVADAERTLAVELLVGLAESYNGEHGLAYAGAALDIEPGQDRAFQLYMYYAQALEREDDVPARQAAYLKANPEGAMAAEAAAPAEAPPVKDDAATHEKVPEPPPPAEAAVAPSPSPPPVTAAPAPVDSPSARGPLQDVLRVAKELAQAARKPEALAKYKEALENDPAHAEALAWVEDYLRTQRDYAQLRDVLLASVRALGSAAAVPEVLESRKARLREVAGLSEGNLRDVDGAVAAYKQLIALDRTDENARQSLMRLLERTQRWDDMANVLEQEAAAAREVAEKVVLEKKLAALHEQKRQDVGSAAEAWARVAHLSPNDDRAITTAVRLFEKAERVDAATQVITENVRTVIDPGTRGSLLEKLGELREQLGHAFGAGEAYANAAELHRSARLWELSEKCFVSVERWEEAAAAADQRALLSTEAKAHAAHLARAAEFMTRANKEAESISRVEQASDLDPSNDDYASLLSEHYISKENWTKLVEFLARRGGRVADKAKRVALRKQAANLYAARLMERELSRDQWLKVLEDGDDREALEKLIDLAIEREDHNEAATLLRRLGGVATEREDKVRIALREAELLADGVGDTDTAIARYEAVLSDLDPLCRPALQAISDLEEARDNYREAAIALERELTLVTNLEAGQKTSVLRSDRGPIAARLARLYEKIDEPEHAIRALDVLRTVDPEDFDALNRLCLLCERVRDWARVADLLAQRIEVEGDVSETSVLTKKLAQVLVHQLDRGEEALAVLTELCDQGDEDLRRTYVELGDHMGWKGIVATKLVEWWYAARHSPERTTALRGAFARFMDLEREQEALRVAVELARSKVADRDLAVTLEDLAVKAGDLDALVLAQEILVRELTGRPRAVELTRQAEIAVRAGVPYSEAIAHSEPGLVDLSLDDAEPLVERLAALAGTADDVIEVYERQVARARAPLDRVRSLARAAQVASAKDNLERAQAFLELALSGVPSAETLAVVSDFAVAGDRATGGEQLRRALILALSRGGTGARDGGRTRASLLRRAAQIARLDLGDIDLAFSLLGDALIAQVDAITLDFVEALGREVQSPSRSDAVFTRALSEVFDGPLVRQLLVRRARLRQEDLGDLLGAAADLKKLHDLSPSDRGVVEQLSTLLRELGDYRAIVQLYEDLILRGKDIETRAELARRVARMWEEQLQDPREAADAWRRVLRMRANDPEALDGLERAKSKMLKKPEPGVSIESYAPPDDTALSTDTGPLTAPPPAANPDSSPTVEADITRPDPKFRRKLSGAARPTPRVPIDTFAAADEFTPSEIEVNSVDFMDQSRARPYRGPSVEIPIETDEEDDDSLEIFPAEELTDDHST